jgi:predicted DNA-binding protein (MmcQ/YjbR family)
MGAFADGYALQRLSTEVALELAAVTLTQPFGPEHDVFKVAGKVFMLMTEATGQPLVTLKCDPQHSVLLRSTFPSITPGWHMNKKHWISLCAGADLTPDLVEDLVLEAYVLVVEKLPRALRPVLPDEIAQLLSSGRA